MAELVAGWIPLLGRALLHFVWQGALIGLVAGCALAAMRRCSPQARYAVACGALLACAVAPVLDLAWQLLRLPLGVSGGVAYLPATAASAAPVAFDPPAAAASATTDAWLPTIVAMWAAGACVFCLRMAMGVAWIEGLRRRPQPGGQREWQERLDTLAGRFGLTRAVALRLVDGMGTPVSAGWWRPVVVLPTAVAARLPVELVEALLAHELAHIRRHDYLVNLLQGVVESLLFYHPAVWWLSRQVRVERELVADALAADAIGAPRRLALALAELSELQPARAGASRLAQAAHGGHLMSRIERLLRPDHARTGGRIAFPLLGIAAACIAFYAHAHFSPRAATTAVARAADQPTAHAPATPAGPAPAAATAVGPAGVLGMPTPATATAEANAIALAQADADADVDIDVDVDPDPDPNPDPVFDFDFDPGRDLGKEIEKEVERGLAGMPLADRSAVRPGHHPRSDGQAFALVRQGRGAVTVGDAPRDAGRLAPPAGTGDFLWFRHDGQAYTVSDPALVARSDRAWRESEAVGRQMEAVGHDMRVQGEHLKAAGKELSRALPRPGRTPAMKEAEQRINALAREQGRLAGEQARIAALAGFGDDAAQSRSEARLASIEQRMEAIGEQIERESDRIEAEAERISRDDGATADFERRMEEAAKPMEALGERMAELGARQEALSTQAERETRAVIAEALRRGLARPAESAVRR